MRMSDWSSDVCSSDLPATITASLNGGLAANGADAPAGPNDATARPSVFSPVVVCLSDFLAIRRSASLKITGKPHSSRSKKQPSAPSSTAFRHSVCIGSGSPPCRRHRSEEHTSELQSLMRISYAVFCLKKKKEQYAKHKKQN